MRGEFMKRFQWIGAALMFLAADLAYSQEATAPEASGKLTLEAAQKEALEHSPVYRRAQDMEKEAGWSQMEAISDGFLPHISIKGEHFFDEKYATENVNFGAFSGPFPENYPETTLALDASFDLFDGFKNVHKLDAANNSHEALKILNDWSLLQTEELVSLKFYQALAAQMLSDMSDENVKTLTDHLRIVQDQLDNGQATKYDVLRVDVQLSEAKSDQISDHDKVILARESLTQAMGLKSDERPLSGRLPVLDSAALVNVIAQASYEDSPQLKASELQAKAAADQSAASQNFWFPKVSLIGEYQWYNAQDLIFGAASPVVNTGDYPYSYYFGASATWDILDGGLSLAKANEADERAKEAKDDYDSARLQTPYDFDFWKRKLLSSVAVYKAKLTDVAEAKESARLATVGFKAGTRTTTDVLDAEYEEYRASAGLVQAQVDAVEALINLELVTGKRYSHD
jgi:outer membrane protein TolC